MLKNPCQRCDQPFNGESKNAYLTMYLGDCKARFRWVMCPQCWEAVLEEWTPRALYADKDGDWCSPLGEQGDPNDVWVEATRGNGRGGPPQSLHGRR